MSDGISKKDWEVYEETKKRLDKSFGFEPDTKSIVRLASEIDYYRKKIDCYREKIELFEEEIIRLSELNKAEAPLSETLESQPLHHVIMNGKSIFDARDAFEMFGNEPNVHLIININIEPKK